MNFYFGHIHQLTNEQAHLHQNQWLSKTIFSALDHHVSTHIEDGISLTLVNDPKQKCPHQSDSIFVNDGFICATDCQLFNKTALANQLMIDPDATNEIFFISSFLKWGEEFPDKFDGQFSFIIWDRNNRTLIAGLDALGYGNFSYSQVGRDLYFSSDLGTLLDQPNVDHSFNMKRVYQCFRYSNNPPQQTYFKHCHYCPPGHVMKLSTDTIETIDYWLLHNKKSSRQRKTEKQKNNTQMILFLY